MIALITGGLGQDASFLAEHLLMLNYEVHATVRMNPDLHKNYVAGVTYHFADLRDKSSLEAVIRKVVPDELYNLAGQTFVPTSFDYPEDTIDVNLIGLARILDIIDRNSKHRHVKVYQASTSEMFGNTLKGSFGIVALDETAKMHPVSPYAVSKHAAHELVDVYRQRGLYVVSGILFNHESERRGPEMVTRKITKHVAKWMHGSNEVLRLGTVSSKRDWGYAKDYVKAMHLMMQQEVPQDFVIGTGIAHSVHELLVMAIKAGDLDVDKHLALTTIGVSGLERTPEVVTLVADNKKATSVLQWKPTHTFQQLVQLMVDCDYNILIDQGE